MGTPLAALSPFGPIFGKELRTTARRKRTYFLRFLYLLALFLVLMLTYSDTAYNSSGSMSVAERAQAEARLGGEFFYAFAMFSIYALAIIAPILTATAISAERLAKTLPVLLMTPITSWQIISGKLFSRMLAALTLIGLSLPVLAVVRLLGGVEVDRMFAILLLCVVMSLFAAAIGLFYSTFMNRAYAVILLSYATMLLLYAFVPFLIVTMVLDRRGWGPSQAATMRFMAAINPFFAATMVVEPMRIMGRNTSIIPCVIVHLCLTAGLVTWAGAVLRRRSRKEGESAATIAPQDYVPFAASLQAMPAANVGDGAIPPPLPTSAPLAYAPVNLPHSKALTRREVSDNPVLWREIRQPLMKRRWQAVVGSIACVLLLLITYVALSQASYSVLKRPDTQVGYSIIFCGLLTLLICVLSATTIASEKESDTWILLLATPIGARAIVLGKLAGILRRLVWPSALIAGHFLIFTLFGIIPFWSCLVALWILFTFNSIWVATGLYLSLRFTKVTFAVILNLLGPVVAYLVLFVLIIILGNLLHVRGERWGEIVGTYAPYSYLVGLFDGLYQRHSETLQRSMYILPVKHDFFWIAASRDRVSATVFVQIVLAVGIGYLILSAAVVAHTIYYFDRIVGRAPQRRSARETIVPLVPSPGIPGEG